ADRDDGARPRDLRRDRPDAAGARPHLRRHRRDRQLPDRDQRHLADRHPRSQALWRRRHRRPRLGRNRGAAMMAAGKPRRRNEPPFWERRGDVLIVRTGEKTDYWNRTFYGFKNGNGHLYAREVRGDFSALAEFAADYRNLYDQAGIMIHVDDRTWLKAGTEFT